MPPERGASRAYLDRALPSAADDDTARRRELRSAVGLVRVDALSASLQAVADLLPLGVGVETAAIRMRAQDGDEALHLLAAAGLPTLDRRRLAYEPLSVAQARVCLALGARHSRAHTLGLRWLAGEWIIGGAGVAGLIMVGSRTARRPTAGDLDQLTRVARGIATHLDGVELRTRALRSASTDMGGQAPAAEATLNVESVRSLRPRERLILELYTDGLSTAEIVDRLVISVHTVRTHVKLARGRLGVASRNAAVEMILADRVHRLL
jgi:DNA-binding CsgD family transcriptional regulator